VRQETREGKTRSKPSVDDDAATSVCAVQKAVANEKANEELPDAQLRNPRKVDGDTKENSGLYQHKLLLLFGFMIQNGISHYSYR
jgi:hypothetical protein